MKQQEKKRRRTNDYKRRRTQSKPPSSSFPIDLTTEILLRLPKKSVARFSCVSKLWSSITSDPDFISLYETRNPRSILLCIKKRDDLFVSSIPQHTQNSGSSYSSSLSIDYHVKLPKDSYLSHSHESVHGLICCNESRNPIVWNPSTRKFLTLPTIPKPNDGWNSRKLFLGYDPVEGKHKVVCIPHNKTSYVCRLFTLGSGQESWRTVRINHKHRSCWYTSGRCINGVIYYLANTFPGKKWIMMSFDVRSETFDMIQLPSDIPNSNCMLLNYGERLVCVARKNGIKLWILEDAKKHKWSRKEFPSPFSLCDQCLTAADFRLNGITHADEFVYVPYNTKSSQRFYILLCDPVRNSCRRFELKGILGNEYGLDYGVEDGPRYELHAFPNHIESQISL